MSLEQEFLHKQFLAQANKLDQKELIEILEIVHANYLVRGSLFYVFPNGVNVRVTRCRMRMKLQI